jgi:hypothetical protein
MKKQLILALTCILLLNCEKDFSPYVYFEEGFHTLKGFWSLGGPEGVCEYKFRNVPRLCGFVTSFPWDVVLDSLLTNSTYEIEVEYWIFTSVDDAELYMVERLDMSCLYYYNIIDCPLSKGPIGDNCYHQINAGRISFIRNNVWVHVGPPYLFDPFECTEIQQVARHIDSTIVVAEKVPSSKQVPAPKVHSIEITSDLPQNWGDYIKVKVTATDPNSLAITYRFLGDGLSCEIENGHDNWHVYRSVSACADPDKFRVRLWAWNENNLIEYAEKEFPFRK